MSFAVTYRLFRHTADIDRSDHRAFLRVDRGDMRHRVTENVNALIGWVEVHAIRIALNFDGLDVLHGLGIEHQERFAAGEPVTGFRVDYGSMRVRRGNLTNQLERVEIIDVNPRHGAGPGKIQAASFDVRIDI